MAIGHNDPTSLDPLSQLIGAQTAQVADLSSRLAELRADILQNRLNTDTRFNQFQQAVEELRIEARTVKHEGRNQEMAREGVINQVRELKQAVASRDQHEDQRHVAIERRILAIEQTISEWKAKLAIIVTVIFLVGSLGTAIVQPLLSFIWPKLFMR